MSLTLGMMAGGAALSAYGKYKENKMNNTLLGMKLDQLDDQRRFLDKNQALTTAAERSQMSAASTVASVNSKNASIEAFQNKSNAEANSGVSGTAGGTSFFNTAKTISDGRTAVNEMNSVAADNMKGMQIGFQQNDLGFDMQRNDLDWQEKYLNLQADQNEYSNSPLSWGLTIASGGLNGAAMGMDLTAMADSMGWGAKAAGAAKTGMSTSSVPASMMGGVGSVGTPDRLSANMLGGFGAGPGNQVPMLMNAGRDSFKGFGLGSSGFAGFSNMGQRTSPINNLLGQTEYMKQNPFSILFGSN